MLKLKTSEQISPSRTPTNLAADLQEINKELAKLNRRASYHHGIINITRINDNKLCAEMWDVAGIERYINKLLATCEQSV